MVMTDKSISRTAAVCTAAVVRGDVELFRFFCASGGAFGVDVDGGKYLFVGVEGPVVAFDEDPEDDPGW